MYFLQIVFLLLLLCQVEKATKESKCFAQPGRGGSADAQRFSGVSLNPALFWSETLQVCFEKQSWSQHCSPSSMAGDSTVGMKNWLGARVQQLGDATPRVVAVLVLLLSWEAVSLKTISASKPGRTG